MISRNFRNACLVLLPAICGAPLSVAEDQAALRASIEKASELHNIKNAPAAFVLQGAIKFWPKENAPVEGRYRLVSTPDGKWKEEVALKGFLRVRIGDGKQFVELDTPDAVIPNLYTLDVLLDFKKALHLREEDSLKQAKPPKQFEQSANCVKRTRKGGTEDTFCFDPPSGDLLSRTSSVSGPKNPWYPDSEEFSEFQSWSGKSYPKVLKAFSGKKLLAEVSLEEFKSSPALPQDFFAAPSGSTIWGDCDDPSPWKLQDRVQPEYPHSARLNRQQGTVTLYVVIEPDGRVSDVRVASSAGPAFDGASIAAVTHWRYVPIGCSGSPGRTATFIDVSFTLRE